LPPLPCSASARFCVVLPPVSLLPACSPLPVAPPVRLRVFSPAPPCLFARRRSLVARLLFPFCRPASVAVWCRCCPSPFCWFPPGRGPPLCSLRPPRLPRRPWLPVCASPRPVLLRPAGSPVRLLVPRLLLPSAVSPFPFSPPFVSPRPSLPLSLPGVRLLFSLPSRLVAPFCWAVLLLLPPSPPAGRLGGAVLRSPRFASSLPLSRPPSFALPVPLAPSFDFLPPLLPSSFLRLTYLCLLVSLSLSYTRL